MNFDEFQTADRRLVMLRGLAAALQFRSNAILLRHYCAAVGHSVSADRLDADLAWLGEQGLVKLESTEGVSVATLTQRGADVANGRAVVPGVAQPQPGV